MNKSNRKHAATKVEALTALLWTKMNRVGAAKERRAFLAFKAIEAAAA